MRLGQGKAVGPGGGGNAEKIIDAALFAVARGARGVQLDPTAIESVRDQFLHKIRQALEESNWQAAWQRERVYMRAYAEKMGRYAAMLAAQDRRQVVTRQDIDGAALKMRGYMPIAGRWCPL